MVLLRRGGGMARGEPRLGRSREATATRDRGGDAARADDVATACIGCRARTPVGRLDHGPPRRHPGGTPGRVADDGGAEHVVARHRLAGPDRQIRRSSPTNSGVLTSPRRGGSGARRGRCGTCAPTSSSTSVASPPTCSAAMAAVRAGRGSTTTPLPSPADPHGDRRLAPPRPHGARRLRRADRQSELPRLRRADPRAHTPAGRGRRPRRPHGAQAARGAGGD